MGKARKGKKHFTYKGEKYVRIDRDRFPVLTSGLPEGVLAYVCEADAEQPLNKQRVLIVNMRGNR